MAKPIEIGVVAVAVLGVGGTFFAGYLLGRSSAPPSAPPATSAHVDDDGDDGDDGDEPAADAGTRPPRRKTKHHADPTEPTRDPAAPPSAPPPRAEPSRPPLEVFATPDASAPRLRVLGPDVHVVLGEVRSGFRRVEWNDAGGLLWSGWIVWRPSRPSSHGGLYTGQHRGGVRGVVRFSGRPPEMKVPKKRKEAELCKTQEIVHDAVIVRGGRLADVVVRVARGSLRGPFTPPAERLVLDQVGCVYTPRIQGAMVGQTIELRNGDATLHNLHAYLGTQSYWNKPQIKGAPPIVNEIPDTNIFVIGCDVHPWMRAFLVVSDHPYFALTGDDGEFELHGVPAGTHTLEAWHSQYGSRTVTVQIGNRVERVEFNYRDDDPAPPENKNELVDLW